MKDGGDLTEITGTIGPIPFDRFNQDLLISNGLAAQDTLSRLRLTLIKFEENPANIVTYGVLLNVIWQIIGRNAP